MKGKGVYGAIYFLKHEKEKQTRKSNQRPKLYKYVKTGLPYFSQSQLPRSKLTEHQNFYAAELRGIDPRGICQLSVQARPLGSLLAGIDNR